MTRPRLLIDWLAWLVGRLFGWFGLVCFDMIWLFVWFVLLVLCIWFGLVGWLFGLIVGFVGLVWFDWLVWFI